MNRPLKPVWGLFFILLGVTAVSLVMRATRPKEIVSWRANYATALAEGRGAGKPVFVYFTASWCGPCQSMKHTTWADQNVEAALRNLVPVKVDIDEHPDLAAQYQVRAVPTFVLLGPEGQALQQTDGAMPPDDFLRWLKS